MATKYQEVSVQIFFGDPRYIQIQKALAVESSKPLSASLDVLLKSINRPGSTIQRVLDIGAGMGQLAYLLFEKRYDIAVLEREPRFIEELKKDYPLFHEVLTEGGRLFAKDLVAHEFTEHYDVIYMNEGPLLLVRAGRTDKPHLLESYIDNRVEDSGPIIPERALEIIATTLRKLHDALNPNAPLILSARDLSDGRYRSNYNGRRFSYGVESRYARKDHVGILTRDLVGGRRKPIKYVQKKFVLSFKDFIKLARTAGFVDFDLSKDRKWFVMREVKHN